MEKIWVGRNEGRESSAGDEGRIRTRWILWRNWRLANKKHDDKFSKNEVLI